MVIRTLDRKLFRDVRQSWRMLLAVSSIIAVGIGCFIGMLSASGNLTVARDHYYSTCRLADFWIDLKKAPVEEVHRLAMIPGVSEIRDRIQFRVVLDLPDILKPVGAMVISMPDMEEPVINNIIIRKGTYFTQGRMNEVILSEKFAEARRLEPGDKIHAVLNNQRKELIVVGTAISAEYVYMSSPGSMVDEPGTYGLMYIKRSFAEDSFGFNNACNSIVGLLAPEAKDDAGLISESIAHKLDSYGVFLSSPRSEQFSPMVLDGEMDQLKSMAITLPSFFLVVASLMLNVLMTRLADQQRTIIGTLKSLGYGNGKLMSHFLKFSTAAGLGGGLIGCFLGIWLGNTITGMYQDYFSFPELLSLFYPGLLFSGLSISVIFALLGTIKGVRRIMKLEPSEAMRSAPPPLGGSVFLENIPAIWRRFDAQWQMIIRGLLRNKGRMLVSIISSALGSSIVVLAFGFVDSIDTMVDVQFEKSLQSDYHLTFSSEKDIACIDEIKRLPGIVHAEPLFNVPCTFRIGNQMKKGSIMGIKKNSQLTIPLNQKDEAIPLPDSGLMMAARLMDHLGIEAGEVVDILPVKGDRIKRQVKVEHSVASMMGLMVYADFSWLNRVMGEENAVSEVRVQAIQNSSQKKQFMARIKAMPGLETVSDIGEQKQALITQMDGAMRSTAVVMILFAAVIFFGAILNGTLISISERQREMATFRTMGYFEYEVARLFLRENLVTNLSGALIGLPLGFIFLDSTMKGIATDAFSFSATISNMSFVYTMILTIIFVLLSQIVVVRTLRSQNWVEAMSLKE